MFTFAVSGGFREDFPILFITDYQAVIPIYGRLRRK